MLVIPRFYRGILLSAVLSATLLQLSCAASPSFDGAVYRAGAIVFRVGHMPPDWKRLDLADASLAFRDARRASVLINAKCNATDEDTPLASLTAHLVMGTTEREYRAEETIPFDGREARHTVLGAKLDGVMMTYDIYVLKKDGCTYDLVYVAPPNVFADGSAAFEGFATGFHTASGAASQ